MIEQVFIERLLMSLLVGGIIGLERQYHDKPAGFATNTLICLGATVFTLTSLYVGQTYGADSARISAQIITGVGFLGAGAIIHSGLKISGLTTAATIWLVAALGMAIGFGEYNVAWLALALTLLLQLFVRKTTTLLAKVRKYDIINLVCDPEWKVLEEITKRIERKGVAVLRRNITKEGGMFVVSIMAEYNSKDFEKIAKDLFEMPEVKNLTR